MFSVNVSTNPDGSLAFDSEEGIDPSRIMLEEAELAVLRDIVDDEINAADELRFSDVLRSGLADGELLVEMGVGNEGMKYLTGFSRASTRTEELAYHSLEDVYKSASAKVPAGTVIGEAVY